VPPGELTLVETGWMDYVRLLFVLGAVLLLAWAAVRLLAPRVSGMRQVSAGPMRVVARMPLEPRKNLYIVKAGASYYLLGTSESGVHHLASLDPEAVGPEPEKPPGPENEFARLLRGLRSSGG
jgi:flagellar protein FliO/FliZ